MRRKRRNIKINLPASCNRLAYHRAKNAARRVERGIAPASSKSARSAASRGMRKIKTSADIIRYIAAPRNNLPAKNKS